MTITEFILARVAEEEAPARATIADTNNSATDSGGAWEFIEYAYEGIWPKAPGSARGLNEIIADDVPWAVHATIHSPARVLRQCEAIRSIVALHTPSIGRERDYSYVGEDERWDRFTDTETCEACGWVRAVDHPWQKAGTPAPEVAVMGCETMRALAAIWADHPDFLPEWA